MSAPSHLAVVDPAAVGVVAGLDPTGGAGLLRDHFTLRAIAPEVAVRMVASVLTEQGRGVARARIDPASGTARSVADYRRRLELLSSGGGRRPVLRSMKIGLIPATAVPATLATLASLRAEGLAFVVLDPVLTATQGGALGGTAEAYFELAREVDLVTPNLHEALALAGVAGLETVEAGGVADVGGLARSLARATGAAVLVKGGHAAPSGPAGVVVDSLAGADGAEAVVRFERPRLPGPDPRGTGCALSSAVAAYVFGGATTSRAIELAVAWLDAARTQARPGPDGRWHLPPPWRTHPAVAQG